MIGMSKSLAREVASRGITVNTIAPGFIETAMTDVLKDEQKTAILSSVPAGRLGTGEEIAAATLYLASDEAAYVTGQTLHVNGGMAHGLILEFPRGTATFPLVAMPGEVCYQAPPVGTSFVCFQARLCAANGSPVSKRSPSRSGTIRCNLTSGTVLRHSA